MTAYALALAGLGTMLIQDIQNHSNNNAAFLASWRTALCEELHTNTSCQLSKCLPKLSSLISTDFPDMAVVQLYLVPCTTDYTTTPAAFVPAYGIDFVSLALFCKQNFVWADAGGVL
jgi:hypothetical protein